MSTMSTPAFKVYDPAKPKRAANISNADWGIHRPYIEDMYAQSLTHAQMLSQLCFERNFKPSKSQLVSRLGKWGLSVSTSYHEHPDSSSRLIDGSPRPMQTDVSTRSLLPLGTLPDEGDMHVADGQHLHNIHNVQTELVTQEDLAEPLHYEAERLIDKYVSHVEQPQWCEDPIKEIPAALGGLVIEGSQGYQDFWPLLFDVLETKNSSSLEWPRLTKMVESICDRVEIEVQCGRFEFQEELRKAYLARALVRTQHINEQSALELLLDNAWDRVCSNISFGKEGFGVLHNHFHECMQLQNAVPKLRAWLYSLFCVNMKIVHDMFRSTLSQEPLSPLLNFILRAWRQLRPSTFPGTDRECGCSVCRVTVGERHARLWERRLLVVLAIAALERVGSEIERTFEEVLCRLRLDAAGDDRWAQVLDVLHNRPEQLGRYLDSSVTHMVQTQLHEPTTKPLASGAIMNRHRRAFKQWLQFDEAHVDSSISQEEVEIIASTVSLIDNCGAWDEVLGYGCWKVERAESITLANGYLSSPSFFLSLSESIPTRGHAGTSIRSLKKIIRRHDRSHSPLSSNPPVAGRADETSGADNASMVTSSTRSSDQRSFNAMAQRIRTARTDRSSITSGHMSLDTASTWSFHRVTGYDRMDYDQDDRWSIAPTIISVDPV